MAKINSRLFINLLLLPLVAATHVTAQTVSDEELAAVLLEKDQALFAAFNACKPEEQKRFLAEDIEFLHDRGGLSRSRDELLQPIIQRCSKPNARLRRELVKSTSNNANIIQYDCWAGSNQTFSMERCRGWIPPTRGRTQREMHSGR